MKRPLRESDIEKYLVKHVKELGGECRKIQFISRPGAPDRVIMRDADQRAATALVHADIQNMRVPEIVALAREIVGMYITWPELKAPGKKAEPHQLREHERMRRVGQRVEVIDSYEGVEALFK